VKTGLGIHYLRRLTTFEPRVSTRDPSGSSLFDANVQQIASIHSSWTPVGFERNF